jgi:hypothetical protein
MGPISKQLNTAGAVTARAVASIAGLASPANSLRAGVAANIGQKRPVPQGMSSTESGSPALRKARRASDTSRQELSLRAQLLRYQRA